MERLRQCLGYVQFGYIIRVMLGIEVAGCTESKTIRMVQIHSPAFIYAGIIVKDVKERGKVDAKYSEIKDYLI